jgi:hypothetical protein
MKSTKIKSEIIEKIISYLFNGIASGTIFRFLSLADLKKNVAAAKSELFSGTDKRIAIKLIIDHLINASVVHRVNAVYTKSCRPFFYIGLEGEAESIQPAEILHGIKKDGVLCFFSAFEIYKLTTQFAPYYHIAELKDICKKTTGHAAQFNIIKEPIKSRDALGSKEIIYNDIPYYLTRRDEKNVISVKNLDIRGAKVKIVSMEQCLVDCFLYDIKSGGINIITEVWETAVNYLEQNIMLNILIKLNSDNLNRKIGFFFDYLNFKPSALLSEYLKRSTGGAGGTIQLLRESNFVNINKKWNILVP